MKALHLLWLAPILTCFVAVVPCAVGLADIWGWLLFDSQFSAVEWNADRIAAAGGLLLFGTPLALVEFAVVDLLINP